MAALTPPEEHRESDLSPPAGFYRLEARSLF
jgi:hypothetical protein